MYLHQSKGSKDARECPFHQAPAEDGVPAERGAQLSSVADGLCIPPPATTAILPCSVLHQ